jgi:hypothetical protein
MGGLPAASRSRRLQGAKFIADHIVEVTEYAFDDFAATGVDKAANLKLLGIKA